MKKLILITIFTLFITLPVSADELLDDFEQGKTQNNWGGSWFYFSDVKDSGNSEILNATLLNNGNYSLFIPDTGGCKSGNCAKMEFILGDKAPHTNIGNGGPTTNYVGIGTDLKPKSGTADIHTAKGITFKARATHDMVIFVELVTSTIYDYAYYRTYFYVNTFWSEFSVDFFDTTVFFPQRFCSSSMNDEFLNNHPLDLSKVIKIIWQVPGDNDSRYCFGEHPQSLSESWYYNPKSNSLYIDDICITGITSTSINKPVYSITHSKNVPQFTTSYGDLLGRRVTFDDIFKRGTGMYILTSETSKNKLHFKRKW